MANHVHEPGGPVSGFQPPQHSGQVQRDRRSRATRRGLGVESGDNGADLERRVARLEFAEGALARLRVPVQVEAEAGRDVVTDIDVLAIDVDQRLRLSRSITECKSGRGQGEEPDRLFWLAGLAKFVRADRATLVRVAASQRGRDMAAMLGLHVFDIPQLDAREAGHAWLPTSFAHIGGAGCTAAEAQAGEQLKSLRPIPADLANFLRHGTVLAPSDRILAALVNLREHITEGSGLPQPLAIVLASHALVGLLLAAIADAQVLDQLRPDQLQRRLEALLTVGGEGQTDVLEVLGAADRLVAHYIEQLHQQYASNGALRQELPFPSLRTLVSEPPGWLPRYIDLLVELRGNPTIGRDLLQTAELACFDAIVGDSAYLSTAFDHLFTGEHRQLLRVAVRTLREIIGRDLADGLGGELAKVQFDRRAPAVPDRRGVPSSGGDAQPELAVEADFH